MESRSIVLRRRVAPGNESGRRRRRARDESGSVLVMVLAVSFVVATAVTVALTTSSAGIEQAGAYGTVTSARLAAESGVHASIVAMERASSYATLPPCTSNGGLSSGDYQLLVDYETGSASKGYSSLGCASPPQPLTAQPSRAVITSTGISGKASVVLQATVTITQNPLLAPAFRYAIYAPGGVPMSVDATVASSDGSPTADIYSGGGSGLQCTNGNVIEGNVAAYEQSTVSLSVTCSISGQLAVAGGIDMSNSASVGSAEAIGGSILVQNTSQIVGDAYAVGGSINVQGGSVGDAFATGSIQGTSATNAYDQAISTMTMPPQPPSPNATGSLDTNALLNDTVPALQAEGYTYKDWSSNCSDASTQLQSVINDATGPLVLYIPCYLGLNGPKASNGGVCSSTTTYTLQANVVIIADQVGSDGCNLFTAATGQDKLAIIVPWDTGNGINLSGVTDFSSSLSTLLCAAGGITGPNYSTLTGQIISGGQVDPTNEFHLTYSNAAASIVPDIGVTGTEQVVLDKEVLLSD